MRDNAVLVAVPEHPRDDSAGVDQLNRIRGAIESQGYDVRWVVSVSDAEAVLRTEAGLAAVLVAWHLPGGHDTKDEPGVRRSCGRSAAASRTFRCSSS